MDDGERGDPRVPVSDSPDRRLPPSREQLPLPRRDGRSHLEPQLREPGGAGSGTPFEAFDAETSDDRGTPDGNPTSDSGGDPDPAAATPPPPGGRVAAFRAAVHRAAAHRSD